LPEFLSAEYFQNKMNELLDWLGKLLVASVKDMKDEFMEEVQEAGNKLEDNIRNGILDAVNIATQPLVYIALAVSISAFGVLFLLYGVSQVLETFFTVDGSGYLLVGIIALVTSLYGAQKASSKLQSELAKK
jgi:gas vesicle protein